MTGAEAPVLNYSTIDKALEIALRKDFKAVRGDLDSPEAQGTPKEKSSRSSKSLILAGLGSPISEIGEESLLLLASSGFGFAGS